MDSPIGAPENLRKRKRMLSNRESARRSRMRKQKHLDDLTAQVADLTADNDRIVTNVNLVNLLHLNMESENSILRAQILELNHRLRALSDIISCMRTESAPGFSDEYCGNCDYDYDKMISGVDHDLLDPWSLTHANQPIMASSGVFMY